MSAPRDVDVIYAAHAGTARRLRTVVALQPGKDQEVQRRCVQWQNDGTHAEGVSVCRGLATAVASLALEPTPQSSCREGQSIQEGDHTHLWHWCTHSGKCCRLHEDAFVVPARFI